MISRLCGRNIEKGKYVRARCPLPVLHFHFIQSTISLPGTHLFHRKKCEGKPQRWDSCGFPNVHTRPQLLAAPLKMCPPPSQTHARSFHTLTIETSLLRTQAHAAYCTHTVINSPATRLTNLSSLRFIKQITCEAHSWRAGSGIPSWTRTKAREMWYWN